MSKGLLFGWSLILHFLCSCSVLSAKSPNIVVILADDLGWNDVSFHGSPEIPTPNIDALAADGVILSNYYVNPLCTPSRSALMTGLYPIHTGMQHDVIYSSEPWGLPLNLTLLPQHLKKLGYSTHAVGKWHLGYFQLPYTPTRRGFDSFFGYYNGHAGYYDHTSQVFSYWGYDLRDNDRVAWEKGGQYATDVFTEEAVDIIKKHNSSKPLFLYLSHLAVHAGNGYSPLESLPEVARRFSQIPDVRRRLFAGMMGSLDDSVGKVVRALNEARLLKDTIVLFTTDNGGASGGLDNSMGSNWPLRGTKATLWEGGVRGVGLVWSTLLGKPAGATRSHLMHMVDWLPTLYHAAGGMVEDLGPIDGVNMWESLVDGTTPSKRDEVLLNIDPVLNTWAIRSNNYKLLSGVYDSTHNKWFGPSGRNNNTNKIFKTLPTLAGKSMVADSLRNLGRAFAIPDIQWYLANEVNCGANDTNLCDPKKFPCLFDVTIDPCEYRNLADSQTKVLKKLLNRINFYKKTAVKPLKVPSDPRADPTNFNFTWTSWVS